MIQQQGKYLVAPCWRDGCTCVLIITVFTIVKEAHQQIGKENKTYTQAGRLQIL